MESPAQTDPPAPSPTPPSPPTPVGVEESQRDQGQKVVVHGVSPTGLTPVVNSREEQYPINANTISHDSPCHLQRNDSQLVTGSDPPSSSAFVAQASLNQSGTSNTNCSHTAAASPNHDPMLSDNRVTEVTTTHQDASNDRGCPCDLITPEIKPTVVPNRPSQSDNMSCGCDESVRISNQPNGLVFSIPNNDAT